MWYKWLLDENKLQGCFCSLDTDQRTTSCKTLRSHTGGLPSASSAQLHLFKKQLNWQCSVSWSGCWILTFTPWIFIKLVYGIFQYERKLQNNWMSCPKFWEYLNRISVYDLLDLLTITIQVELFFPSMLGKKKMELTNGGDSASYVTVTR